MSLHQIACVIAGGKQEKASANRHQRRKRSRYQYNQYRVIADPEPIKPAGNFEQQGKNDKNDWKMKDERMQPADKQEDKRNLIGSVKWKGQKQYTDQK